MADTVIDSIDEIERSYEYLVAFASQSQETEADEVRDHIETLRDGLREGRMTFQRDEQDPAVSSFFSGADEQTNRAVGAIELFLRNAEVNPESVEALLSLASLRGCLTIFLYLEEIDEL